MKIYVVLVGNKVEMCFDCLLEAKSYCESKIGNAEIFYTKNGNRIYKDYDNNKLIYKICIAEF